MSPFRACACLLVFCNVVFAQPALVEPPEFPPIQSGPQAVYGGEGCFLLAQGVIIPGDVDWLAVRIPRASTRTVVDVDFPAGSGASALLAMVVNGTTGFNVADNNNARDALCGLGAGTSPLGNTRDSAVDLRETSINAMIHIAVTGAADTSFVGMHTEFFSYEVWVYAEPYPCVNDASCDDGVACTVDQCNVAAGDCTNTPDDAACDDGFFCDGPEWCDGTLGCRAGTPPVCQDDGVSCTDEYCDWGLDQCVSEPDDEWCDNGLFCDGFETCDAQTGCQAGEAVDCDDGVACTVDACDDNDWVCVHTADDGACDDGMFCNGAEVCDLDNGCMAGSDPCPNGTCRESDDSCALCLADADCDDGVFCNGQEQCGASGCTSGAAPCGPAMCRESDDSCVECLGDWDCDDGDYCNGEELCSTAGACEAGVQPCGSRLCRESDDQCVDCLSHSDCDDGVYCNGSETCGAVGNCMAGADPCAFSMCRESDDRCVECLSDVHCDDSQYCNGAEICDAAGSCVTGGHPCGESLCRESDDRCVECLGDADCEDAVFCNGAEHCDSSGACGAGQKPCGADRCREGDQQCVECLSDADCGDGLFCNGDEVCDPTGMCTEGKYACGDELCDEGNDQCVECFADSDCNDDLFCNGSEKCDGAGKCAAGNSPCQSGETCNEQSDQCVRNGFTMDVRPGVCPARIVTNVRGNLPVAIVGTDVRQIRPNSIRLSRADGVGKPVDPLSNPKSQAPHFGDVSAPANPCECSSNGPDGHEDLVVAFKLETVIQALRLEKVKNGTQVELRISGKLKNGMPFSTTDCVIIQSPGRKGTGVSGQ